MKQAHEKGNKKHTYNKKMIFSPVFMIVLLLVMYLILINDSYASTNINNNYSYQTNEETNQSDESSLQEDDEITLININTATAEELAKYLPGIGEALSNYIVEYREENGSFNSIDELLNVKGIGENRLKVITPYVTV